ncbi:MAG: PIG-L family deacetylase [Chloroflexota bacterium]
MTARVDFLAVRPHPDDESSATGGLLAKYAAAGLRTGVVTCTGGEEGEIHDPDLVYEEAFPRLRHIRERELREACEVLGVSEIHLLGYRDSGMMGTDANKHPEAFWNVDVDAAAFRLAALMRRLRPRVVVTENEHGGYGHPDHIMCHRITVRAWEMVGDLGAPIDGDPWRPDRLFSLQSVVEGWDTILDMMRAEGLDTTELEKMMERRRQNVPATNWDHVHAAVDVADYAHVQREALLRHRTQIPPNSFFMGLPPHIRKRAFATTYLRRLHPGHPPEERLTDLFA